VGLTLALCVQSTVQAQTGQPATGPQTGDARVGEYTLEQAEMLVNEKVAEKMRAISERRRENIIKLESLLQNVDYRKDQDRAPKVLHMLAENHWEEGLFQYLQRRTEWDKALDQFNAGTLSTRPDEPVEDYSQSLEYYRKILREFPNYPRIDEVIFYLGKGAMKEGKAKQSRALQKEGVDFLNRLVKNYPKSRFLAEAHLAMAEYYFETNSLAFARFNYDVIIEKYQKSAMYNYALYKLGWVHFNLADFDKAVETFQSVVAMVGKEQSQGVIEFKNQALNDLVVTYAEVPNGWMQARDYFMKVLDEKEAYRKMRALGDLLVAQDKDPEAIAVFRHFIEREKTTRNIPEYFGILLSIYKKTNDMPNLDAVTAEIIEYFKPNGTWITVNKNDEEVVDAANLMTEEYLLFLANFYHVEAQRLKSADMYRRAADRYATYLTRFGDSKNAYKVNFYYAEILYEQMKDFAKAKEQYQRVIERETKGEFVEDSALGVIYSTQELMVAEGIEGISKKAGMEVVKVDPKAAEAPIPETALHPLEVDYIAGADKYVELLTELIKDPEVRKKNPERGEKIPEIMYIAASLYYRHGKFQEAVNRLRILFEYDKSSKYAAYAVFTLLDCYQRLAQWPMVEEWARKLIAARNFTVRKEADLKKIVAIAMTENARLLSVEKKYDSAIAEAMRVYEEFRRNEDMASKALFNVAALYEGQKEVDKAVRTYLRVVKEFPKAEVAPEALFTIGLIYESQTEFDKAADYFESMEQFKALKEPTEADKKENWKKLQEQISDALQNAGLIREALGQPKEAIDVYQKFVKYFPGDAEVPKVYLRIGTVYENQGDAANLKRAHDHYQLWLKKNYPIPEMTIEALARSGDCLKRIDKVKNRRAATLFFQRAQEVFSRSIANPDVVNKAKVFAAQAAFEVADYAYDDFTVLNIPSTLNPSVLKRSLEAKAEAQIKAEKMFDAVLDYKSGGWSAGSLFKIGLMYFEFKEKLLEVPVPDGLDPDTENMYLAILEEIARPVEEKSLRAFERALKLAHEEKVYNVWSKACAQYAAKVNQDTFPVAGDDQVKANHIKDTLASTSFIRSLRRGDVEVKMVQEARR
jgi:tetratricopeptide (TPR) repeat protein